MNEPNEPEIDQAFRHPVICLEINRNQTPSGEHFAHHASVRRTDATHLFCYQFTLQDGTVAIKTDFDGRMIRIDGISANSDPSEHRAVPLNVLIETLQCASGASGSFGELNQQEPNQLPCGIGFDGELPEQLLEITVILRHIPKVTPTATDLLPSTTPADSGPDLTPHTEQ